MNSVVNVVQVKKIFKTSKSEKKLKPCVEICIPIAFHCPFASYVAGISASSTPQPASLLYMNAKETSYI